MANLVKWWKQFRQYKVIHECSTDSEELIHASEYGDIVMQQKEKKIHQNLESQDMYVPIKTPLVVKESLTKNKRPVKDHEIKERYRSDIQERLLKRHSIATTHNLEQLEKTRSKYNKISCDVSLEDSFEKSKPMNFTFTLYDIEGHGIITKEDISSIVSTIYDSIGSTIVTPLYGKKVINVKLTMSPQDIIKSNEHNQRIKRTLSTTHKHIKTNTNQLDSESINIVPVIKLQNDINSHETTKNCENFESEKNNLYESINNLKGYKPTIEKILSKSSKTENADLKNCLDLNISENLQNEQSRTQFKNNMTKKRIVRKQRNQKQKLLEKAAARGRSLSVGNEYRSRKIQDQKLNKTAELNNGSKLRRNELIEIIRESMEKNKLCFQQSNRKTTNNENFGRQRSNTITMMEAQNEQNNNVNHCSFDSYLHSALCGKFNNSNKIKRLECMMNKPALTLKTSLVNQLNPLLTPEQKLARKLNDIEKWLIERESATNIQIKATPDKNVLNHMKYDKLKSEILYETETNYNQKLLSPQIEKSLSRCPKLQKDAINSIKNKNISTYPMNIYVEELEKLRECENLISSSESDDPDEENLAIYANVNNNEKCEEQTEKEKTAAESSSVRFVHIHHHYYHFDNEKTDNH